MKHEDVDTIVKIVSDLVASSTVAMSFKGVVDVQEGSFSEDDKFLKILVHLDDLLHLSDGDIDDVASSIEGAVSDIDDRFPSVRFADDP